MVAILVVKLAWNMDILYRIPHTSFLPSLCLLVSEEKIFKFQPIRNKNFPWRPWFLSNRDEMRKSSRGPSIDASYKMSVHLAKRFQRRRFFRNRPNKNKNCIWQPCLLTDWDETSNLYRGPSIEASYQVVVHLA